MLHELRTGAHEWGLQQNWDKTQLMVQGLGKGRKRRFPHKGDLYYEGRLVKSKPVAKYLGTLLAASGSHTHEVRSRVSKATTALSRVARGVWRHAIGLELKVRLYLTLVRSVLCYGTECWHLNKTQLRMLEQVQNRALRWASKAPSHITHETSEALRERLRVPTVESWIRLARLRWLRKALRAPELHQQALCALFGSTQWDAQPPTVSSLGHLAQMRDDLEALFGTCDLTPAGRIAESTLARLRDASETALEGVLSYTSTAERQQTRLIGPRNRPVHQCSTCAASFDTLQRKALHEYSAHGHRNARRAVVTEARCPYCEGTFASLETARRHVVGNVCGMVPLAPTPAPEARPAATTVLRLLQQQAGQAG